MDGKVIAVTGGAQGIGFETAKLLVSRGAKVSIGDLDQAKLDNAEEHFRATGNHGSVRLQKLNVTDSKQVDGWIKDTVQWAGKLNAAVNAAGINCSESGQPTLAETSDERWDMLLQVNLSGMFYCLRSELNNIEDGGAIVCIASVQGLMGFATSAAYSATKHGVVGLVRSAAKENGERNVRVNAVAPGAIDTRMVLDAHRTDIRTPIQRIGRPEEVASLISFLLSDDAGFITGATYSIDGGWAC
ncbi:hypothetical protein B0J12DRAFT_455788 [Macrophomina phaseolina]|uniref:Short-chain dehydrogenase/reductase SDR n=1 Tax=Macrophomina phaseolina TaxID=35725 RepID=A0ABQ8GFT7_9PEZI|nr:hypothetical protein B0J12DRAFT_455788 [Macrophomina phaseolina]